MQSHDAEYRESGEGWARTPTPAAMTVPLSDTRLTEIRVLLGSAMSHADADGAITDLLVELDRLRAENAGLDDLRLRAIDKNDQLCAELAEYKRTVAYFDEQSKRRKTERDQARAQVRAASTVKCWTNEDGHRFVFAEDLAFALGYTPSSAVAVDCPTCGHLLCKGDGQCGAILTVFADGIRRCQCTGVDATQSAGAGQ